VWLSTEIVSEWIWWLIKEALAIGVLVTCFLSSHHILICFFDKIIILFSSLKYMDNFHWLLASFSIACWLLIRFVFLIISNMIEIPFLFILTSWEGNFMHVTADFQCNLQALLNTLLAKLHTPIVISYLSKSEFFLCISFFSTYLFTILYSLLST